MVSGRDAKGRFAPGPSPDRGRGRPVSIPSISGEGAVSLKRTALHTMHVGL